MKPLHHWQIRNLLVSLALCPTISGAVNMTQCLTDVISCANNSSSQECISSLNISSAAALSALRTSEGSTISVVPVSIDQATALSYAGCYDYCGDCQESFSWTTFSQEFSAWLLPYLALLSQLPFGAPRRTDDLMSLVLTVGSPALAGYSLFVTLLNARWVNDRLFSGVDYPSAAVRRSVVQVLSSLQQVPLRVHPGEFEFLVVHPDNDDWWTTLAAELDYTRTWSISSAISITWVIIAYLITFTDSLSSLTIDSGSVGQGTSSLWLCLLPIVVGWLVAAPKCDHMRVHGIYNKANRQVFVASSHDTNAAPTQDISNFGLTINSGLDLESRNTVITSPDELRTPPVFNYARMLSWSRTAYIASVFYSSASRKLNQRIGVDGEQIPWNVRDNVPRESRLGNHDQIIRYCHPDDHGYHGLDVLWPRGVFFNMIVASLSSLQLQWGTTGAALVAVWFTPTVGLGCRSVTFLIYGGLSTTACILLVSSSVFGYYTHHLIHDLPVPGSGNHGKCTTCTHSKHPECTLTPSVDGSDLGLSVRASGVAIQLHEIQAPNVGTDAPLNTASNETSSNATTLKYPRARRTCAQIIARIADWLRWTGKSLAIVNAIWIISTSVAQYAGMYNNYFCNSSIWTWGISSFNVIAPNAHDIDLMRGARIGALVLALASGGFFVGTIYLLRDSLPN